MKKSILLYAILFGVSISCQQESAILFQDDFEHHEVNKSPDSPWKVYGEGTVAIDTTKSFSGKQSVHFVSGEGYKNRAFIGLDHLFPVQGNTYYGKLKMYVEEASPDGIHWTMIQSSGKVQGEQFSAEVRYGGQHHKNIMANYDTQGVRSDCWQHSNVQLPEQEWFTIDWFFDGTHNLMKFWLNGKEVSSVTVQDKGEGCVANDTNGQWKFPVFENVLVGWVDYQTGGGHRSVWIDDVILSTTMIKE